MMIKLKIIVLSIVLLCTSSLTYAWSFAGHVLIAQIAYDQLTLEKQNKANQFAEMIFTQLPNWQQRKLNQQYPHTSTFAKVAMLPDTLRNDNLFFLFLKFQAIPSMNLLFSLPEKTGNWHYIDTPFPQNKSCEINSNKNIVWAIHHLKKSIASAKFDSTKALELVMLEHLIGDIHQPLHTATNVSSSCEGDRGGNNYCLQSNRYGKCYKNLHSLWDSGVGYLKPRQNIKALARRLEYSYPISQFQSELAIKNVSDWANENTSNLYFIYSTPEYRKPNANYYQTGQALAQKQIMLAAYRLAQNLNEVLS